MSKFKEMISGAGQKAKHLIDKASEAADQDGDGKFGFSDIAVVADKAGQKAKSGLEIVKDTVDEKAKEHQKNVLQPIFTGTIDSVDFSMPKFIRVIDRDKKHAESDMCKGSIGHFIDVKKQSVVNLYRDSISNMDITFYPDCDSELYYVDPSDRNCYIALEEYFNYLKVARIKELQKIAQDLGAKHFKVTYREESVSFSKVDAKAKVAAVAEADASHNLESKKYSKVEIASDMTFPGHDPSVPELKYMKRDPSIQSLVEMRLNESSPLLKQTYMLKLSNSSGIKENDAIQLDAILNGLKYKGNATIVSEVQNEARRYLEYEIEF